MNCANLLISIIICGLILLIFIKLKNQENYQNNINNTKELISKPKKREKKIVLDYDDNYDESDKVNKYFVDMQFHDDYRDTLDAFDTMDPNKKPFFNQIDLPIIGSGRVQNKEITEFIDMFIKQANNIINNDVGQEMELNGWNTNLPHKEYKSGWEKQLESLGLPGSIYNKPAPKANIKLVKIDRGEKYETENEIRYICYIILQKQNVSDQMVVCVNFVIDKKDPNIDRDFFSPDKNTYNSNVKLEQINIIGFMTKRDFGKSSKREQYYDFGDAISDGKMFNQKEIMTILNNKRKALTQVDKIFGQ